MKNSEPAQYSELLEIIRQWPPEAGRDLLREVGRTLDDERPVRPTRGYSAEQVIRRLSPGRPAPSDEMCDRILGEELMTKYGL